MAEHRCSATVVWRHDGSDFRKGRYSRGHVWRFDGGVDVPASSSTLFLRPPLSVEAAIDPEKALVASLSACHMLTFLDLARRAGFVVDSYEDTAEGILERKDAGQWWMSKVTLMPAIAFAGEDKPTAADLERLHNDAHHACIVANSVLTEVVVAPAPTDR